MKKFLLVFVSVVLLWPAVASAQSTAGRATGPNDKVERVARVIRDCEVRTNDFRQAVERAWGRTRRSNNDELDRSAVRLERALNRVRDAWNRDQDFRRARGYVGAAIEAGKGVNRALSRHRLSSRLSPEWKAIKAELMNLAEIFEQPPIRW
jgi:hypothetical protein